MMKMSRGLHPWQSNDSAGITIRLRPVLLWMSSAVALFGFLFGFDMIAEGVEDGFTVVFEFAVANLESMYRKLFKMNLYQAQMATAYTLFAVSAPVAWLIAKRFAGWFQLVRKKLDVRAEKASRQWHGYWNIFMSWWNTLDTFNKIFSAFVFAMVIIPLVVVIFIVLGNLIAELA